MDSPIIAPLSVAPSASASAELHAPISSLEIAFGQGATVGQFLGVLWSGGCVGSVVFGGVGYDAVVAGFYNPQV